MISNIVDIFLRKLIVYGLSEMYVFEFKELPIFMSYGFNCFYRKWSKV